ncbi:hypothetical protein AALD01_02590 [Oscillospiraceae bacterium 21-37]
MGKTKLTCRVCGKEYEPCRTAIKNPNVFHWQEVACSPECGAKYLQRVKDSRKSAEPIKKSKVKKAVEHNIQVPSDNSYAEIQSDSSDMENETHHNEV